MEKFKQLKVWQKSRELILEVYKITKDFPNEEKFGLISQMRRAAISIAANITEGSRRKTIKDRKHFHNMADTSLEELKFYFIICYDLDYIKKSIGERLTSISREIGRMLYSLNKKL